MMLRILEKSTTFTPLGIRFWDPVLNDQIRDRLKVTARLEDGQGQSATAYRTASDIYAFSGLPGLRSIEYSTYPPGQIESPPKTHKYIIEVEDTRRRFIRVARRVELPLPYTGIFLSRTEDSPPQSSARFILYSSPTRTAPSWLTVIRSELASFATGAAAAHAVVKIRAPGGRICYGLADEQGRVGIFMPYPTIEGSFVGSPRIFVGKPLFQQNWDLTVEVFYEPNLLTLLPHTNIPDYLNILSQKKARIWKETPEEGSPGEAGWEVLELLVTLEFGKELTLRTEGQSKLMISPTES